MSDAVTYLTRQSVFSRATFGPGARTKGLTEHIKEELKEIEEAETLDLKVEEWADVAILAFDGLMRAVREEFLDNYNGRLSHDMVAETAWARIRYKQQVNELRDWPDWRGSKEDEAINHIRGEECT